jgi:hypothetical protein
MVCGDHVLLELTLLCLLWNIKQNSRGHIAFLEPTNLMAPSGANSLMPIMPITDNIGPIIIFNFHCTFCCACQSIFNVPTTPISTVWQINKGSLGLL